MATLNLPNGWRRVDSTSHPGEYYYSGPNGATWTHPVTGRADEAPTAAAPVAVAPPQPTPPLHGNGAPKRSYPHTTFYRQDFKTLPSAEAIVDRIDRITQYNPSNAPHPKARPHVCNFNSTNRVDYAPPIGVVPQPPAHQWSVPVPVAPLGETTTYRADFTPLDHSQVARPKRTTTPPKLTKFVYTSTQRATYSARAVGAAEPSPRRPTTARTGDTESAAKKADMTSFVFNDAAHRLPPAKPVSATRGPRHSQDQGTSIFGFSPRALRPASSTYREDFLRSTEMPTNHRLAARDHVYLPWRAGQNAATADQFDTLYSRSYTNAHERDRVAQLMKTCHEVDGLSKSRAKAHQELSAEL